jgi:hypothetical protein
MQAKSKWGAGGAQVESRRDAGEEQVGCRWGAQVESRRVAGEVQVGRRGSAGGVQARSKWGVGGEQE